MRYLPSLEYPDHVSFVILLKFDTAADKNAHYSQISNNSTKA
jgi:hypothetical protein